MSNGLSQSEDTLIVARAKSCQAVNVVEDFTATENLIVVERLIKMWFLNVLTPAISGSLSLRLTSAIYINTLSMCGSQKAQLPFYMGDL